MIPAIVEPERAFAMIRVNDWRNLQAGGRTQERMWACMEQRMLRTIRDLAESE